MSGSPVGAGRGVAWLGCLGVAGMVVATTVFAGMAWGRIGAAEPSYLPGAIETYLADHLAYRGSLSGFERLANGCLVVGVLALGVLGLVRHAAAGPAARTPAAGIDAAAYGAGAVVFAAAQLAYLAAAERILAVHATPGFDRAALATMLDVADRTDDYAENLGLLLLASGLLALGRQVRPRRQRITDSGLALMITVVVITSLLRSPLNDPALVLAGGLAAPVWTALTVRYVRDPSGGRHRAVRPSVNPLTPASRIRTTDPAGDTSPDVWTAGGDHGHFGGGRCHPPSPAARALWPPPTAVAPAGKAAHPRAHTQGWAIYAGSPGPGGWMRLVLAVVATVAGAALAGAAATVAVAAATTSPALFLGAGAVAALAVWFAAAHLIGRGRGPGLRWGVRVAGALTVAAGLAAVLVPLGDPVRPPAAPPGAGAWTLPDGGRLAHGVVRAAPGATPATPVVVLHGGPGVPDLAGHLAALAPLAADGHDVWAYAQRGTGGSSRLADPSGYTTGLAVDDLEQVRRRIGAGRLILLGHSYGSFLAAAYTAAHPERVERLVFSSPGDLRQGGIGGRPQSRLDAGRTLRLYGLLAPPRAMLAYALTQVDPAAAHAFAGDRELDARQDRVFAATLPALHCPGRSGPRLYGLGFYASQVPQSVNRPAVPDPAGQLAGSPTPALVIKGECDYLGWGSATAYLDAFPDSTLSYVPGAGHDAYLDEPERWVAAVRGFLDGSPVPGALPDPHRAPDGYGRR